MSDNLKKIHVDLYDACVCECVYIYIYYLYIYIYIYIYIYMNEVKDSLQLLSMFCSIKNISFLSKNKLGKCDLFQVMVCHVHVSRSVHSGWH